MPTLQKGHKLQPIASHPLWEDRNSCLAEIWSKTTREDPACVLTVRRSWVRRVGRQSRFTFSYVNHAAEARH